MGDSELAEVRRGVIDPVDLEEAGEVLDIARLDTLTLVRHLSLASRESPSARKRRSWRRPRPRLCLTTGRPGQKPLCPSCPAVSLRAVSLWSGAGLVGGSIETRLHGPERHFLTSPGPHGHGSETAGPVIGQMNLLPRGLLG